MTRIVVTDSTFPSLDHERSVAEKYGATLVEAHCSSVDDVLRIASGANVLLVQFAQITSQAIELLPQKAAIIRYGLGLDNIDLQAAQRCGIRVAYVPDYATGEVADHTATLILTALRKIIPLDRSIRDGLWDPVRVAQPVQSFEGSTVGFIGFGRIGRQVHQRLKVFGFECLVFDPDVDMRTFDSLGVRSADLYTTFSAADVLTLHAPLTHQSRHIVNAHTLKLMKPTAIIVNTARGELIDSPAMEEALASHKIAGAALDVFEKEPLPENSRLRHLKNVILTPHAAWYSMKSTERVQRLAADEVERALTGRPARCPAPIQ